MTDEMIRKLLDLTLVWIRAAEWRIIEIEDQRHLF